MSLKVVLFKMVFVAFVTYSTLINGKAVYAISDDGGLCSHTTYSDNYQKKDLFFRYKDYLEWQYDIICNKGKGKGKITQEWLKGVLQKVEDKAQKEFFPPKPPVSYTFPQLTTVMWCVPLTVLISHFLYRKCIASSLKNFLYEKKWSPFCKNNVVLITESCAIALGIVMGNFLAVVIDKNKKQNEKDPHLTIFASAVKQFSAEKKSLVS